MIRKQSRKLIPLSQDAVHVHGELQEGFHIAGYSFERGCLKLEWILKEDRWKLGSRFAKINDFLDSLRFDELQETVEQRKRIGKLIKDLQPKVSNRQIAKIVKLPRRTIDRAVGQVGPLNAKNGNQNKQEVGQVGPTPYTGAKAAALVVGRQTAKQDRLDKVAADESRVLALRPIVGKVRTIILDPAWDYTWLSLAGRAKPGYAMQTIEQLLALDVAAWADDEVGCHLYCCTVNNFMAEACKLVAHWGFQHRTVLTWEKPPPFGMGSYFRNSTEHVIFATRGKTTTRHAAASIPTHFQAPRGEQHSEKPEKLYEIIRAASYPPYGEGNQRVPRPDFQNLFCPVTDAPEDYKPESLEAAE
jgi:N6-adenosine-specific RNA methylase IME4